LVRFGSGGGPRVAPPFAPRRLDGVAIYFAERKKLSASGESAPLRYRGAFN